MRERAARIGGKLTVTQLSEIRSQGKLNSLPRDKGDAPSHGPITHLERFALRFPFRKPSYEHLLALDHPMPAWFFEICASLRAA